MFHIVHDGLTANLGSVWYYVVWTPVTHFGLPVGHAPGSHVATGELHNMKHNQYNEIDAQDRVATGWIDCKSS